MSAGSYGPQIITSRRIRLALVALAAAAVCAVPAAPANALKPPRVWTGTVEGTDHAHPSVGTTTTWTADVTFKRVAIDRRRRNHVYVGTGSASYDISGGTDCTATGSATYSIGGNDAGLNVIRTRSGWKYAIEITLIGEDFTGVVHCPDQAVEEETFYLPEPLLTDRRSRPVPGGLSSISGTHTEGGHYTTTWDLSGTPRGRLAR